MLGPRTDTAKLLPRLLWVLACLALTSAAPVNAQQTVYPYPVAQQPQPGALSIPFSNRPVFRPQFSGQGIGTLPPRASIPAASFDGFQRLGRPQIGVPTDPGIGLSSPPATFGNFAAPQPSLQLQPGLVPQAGFVPQNSFGPQAGQGIPNGFPPGAIPADIDVIVQRGRTGRLSVGGTVSSDSDFIGQLILDERDFNIFAFPRRLSDLSDPRVFRGLGQSLRAEIVPGSDVERYLVSFGDPYFLNTNTSFNISGYFYDRQFSDWDEERAGVKIKLGQSLTNFLSVSGGLTLENVEIDNPRLATSPQLNADLGDNSHFVFDIGLVYDTRQSPFLLDSGSYLALTFKQAFGDFSYSRGEIDYRWQRLIYKRTPTTGHHTLSLRTKLGFSGSSTPVFENFIGGGFSSLRGFDFRGVGPVENGIRVGGEFQWLNSLEYQFPITNDDMVMGVAFVDFGTIEEDIEINSNNFRVAPGLGLRINVPFAGISAPLALDFAFPTDDATGDDRETFSWLIGFVR